MPAISVGEPPPSATGSNARIKYSCFISYKRPYDAPPDIDPELVLKSGDHIYEQIATGVRQNLAQRVDPRLPPFLDLAQPYGANIRAKLSDSLCRSACMVAIITPEYFDSAWCLGEWEAMKRLEAKRIPGRKSQDRGLIIPVLFQGNEGQLKAKCEGRNVAYLGTLLNIKTQLKNVGTQKVIARIADDIRELVKLSGDCECGTFLIELGKPGPTIPDPNPMAT